VKKGRHELHFPSQRDPRNSLRPWGKKREKRLILSMGKKRTVAQRPGIQKTDECARKIRKSGGGDPAAVPKFPRHMKKLKREKGGEGERKKGKKEKGQLIIHGILPRTGTLEGGEKKGKRKLRQAPCWTALTTYGGYEGGGRSGKKRERHASNPHSPLLQALRREGGRGGTSPKVLGPRINPITKSSIIRKERGGEGREKGRGRLRKKGLTLHETNPFPQSLLPLGKSHPGSPPPTRTTCEKGKRGREKN